MSNAAPLHIEMLDEPPEFLRAQPSVSSVITIDDDVPLVPLLRVLAANGYRVAVLREGRLVITHRPDAFK